MAKKEIIQNVETLEELISGGKKQAPLPEEPEGDKSIAYLGEKFFGVKDRYGLSKTDFDKVLVYPVAGLVEFSQDPLPLYNRYLRKKKLSIVMLPRIEYFVLKLYLLTSISKNRLSRGEGTNIIKGMLEKITEQIVSQMPASFQQKIVDDLRK